MDTRLAEDNLITLFNEVPLLERVLLILNNNKFRYGIFAGACVSLLTSNREPTDIDILVADEDFNRLKEYLNGFIKKDKGTDFKGKFFYLDEGDTLEFVPELDFVVDRIVYPIRLTNLAWENVFRFTVDGTEVILLNPVDTLLEKAILPRGAEVRKHDLEDIAALVDKTEINREYLKKRVKEMRAEEKVRKVLSVYNLV